MTGHVQIEPVPPDLEAGLAQIGKLYPERFGAGTNVSFVPSDDGLRVDVDVDDVRIGYSRASDAFRGLGQVMGDLLISGSARPRSQPRRFESVSVLLDCSRNAVPTTAALFAMLRRWALMGITSVYLYMEDTYEIPSEPFFGHGRARFDAAELKAVDDVAHALGIEVVPCIQTLGHLGNMLRWPAFASVKDTSDVLLADEDRTYELIRTMLETASGPVRSRRIHIGMDETWGLGSGVHRQRFGSQPPTAIFARHLRRVLDLCRGLGLAPMLWSDMLLRFASPWNRSSDLGAQVPPEIADALGADATLVYWDYNHPDAAYHEAQIERHLAIGHRPVVTGAVHTWLQKWANLPNSIRSLSGQLEAASSSGITEVMVAMWGNDGNECDYRSALPAVQAFADFAYTGTLLSSATEVGFAGSCDATARAWFDASAIDLPGTDWGGLEDFDPARVLPSNASAWILWTDPLLDLVAMDVAGATPERYRQIAEGLEHAAGAGLPGDALLGYPALLARTLELKIDLHRHLRPAYASRESADLDVVDGLLRATSAAVDNLREAHQQHWHESNKSTGWEVLERRYAGLLSRLDTLADTIRWLRADPDARIESLERPQLPLQTRTGQPIHLVRHDLVTSGSLTTT